MIGFIRSLALLFKIRLYKYDIFDKIPVVNLDIYNDKIL